MYYLNKKGGFSLGLTWVGKLIIALAVLVLLILITTGFGGTIGDLYSMA